MIGEEEVSRQRRATVLAALEKPEKSAKKNGGVPGKRLSNKKEFWA